MENIFKADDKVYDINFGWGVVNTVNGGNELYPVEVTFFSITHAYTRKGCFKLDDEIPRLSFTQYIYKGFSQERPFDPKDCVGKWCRVFDHPNEELDDEIFRITKIYSYDESTYFIDVRETAWVFAKPLTEEQLQAFNLTND